MNLYPARRYYQAGKGFIIRHHEILIIAEFLKQKAGNSAGAEILAQAAEKISAIGFIMIFSMDQTRTRTTQCFNMVMRDDLVGKDEKPRNEKNEAFYFNTFPQKTLISVVFTNIMQKFQIKKNPLESTKGFAFK